MNMFFEFFLPDSSARKKMMKIHVSSKWTREGILNNEGKCVKDHNTNSNKSFKPFFPVLDGCAISSEQEALRKCKYNLFSMRFSSFTE